MARGAVGKEGQGAMATMVAVAQALGSVAVSLTALTVIIVEGVPMLYEAFKKAKLAQGREQGRAEGRAEGHAEGHAAGRAAGRAEGHAEGHAAEREAWEDWIARRDAAQAAGLDFTEPSPAQRDQRETVAS